jgi:hypothetical protein
MLHNVLLLLLTWFSFEKNLESRFRDRATWELTALGCKPSHPVQLPACAPSFPNAQIAAKSGNDADFIICGSSRAEERKDRQDATLKPLLLL